MAKKPHACENCARRRQTCSMERPTCDRCRKLEVVCSYERSEATLRRDRNKKTKESRQDSKTELTPKSEVLPRRPSMPSMEPPRDYQVQYSYLAPSPGMMGNTPINVPSPGMISSLYNAPSPGIMGMTPGIMPVSPDGQYNQQVVSQQPGISPQQMVNQQMQMSIQMPPSQMVLYPYYPSSYSPVNPLPSPPVINTQSSSGYSPYQTPENRHDVNFLLSSPRTTHYQMPIDQLQAVHRQMTKSQSNNPNYHHYSNFTDYFKIGEYFRDKVLYRDLGGRPVLEPAYFDEMIKIALDICYLPAPVFHCPSIINSPMKRNDAILCTMLNYAMLAIDGTTSLPHFSEARNLHLTLFMARRAIHCISQTLIRCPGLEETQDVIWSLIGMGVQFAINDKRHLLVTRYVGMASLLVQDYPIEHIQDPIIKETMTRCRWFLYLFVKSGSYSSKGSVDVSNLIRGVPLPISDDVFQVPLPVFGEPMMTLDGLDGLTEEFKKECPRFSVLAWGCVLYYVQTEIRSARRLGKDMKPWEELLEFMEKQVLALPVDANLASNDPHMFHPVNAAMLLYLTWALMYLPDTMEKFLDEEWSTTPEFSKCMKRIAEAAVQMEKLVEGLNVASLGNVPGWNISTMVKISILFVSLVLSVKETTQDPVDDLVTRCKMFVIGLRYAAFSDRSLHTVADLLEGMVTEKPSNNDLKSGNSLGKALATWLVHSFPLTDSKSLPSDFVDAVLPVTTNVPGREGYVDFVTSPRFSLTEEDLRHDLFMMLRRQ